MEEAPKRRGRPAKSISAEVTKEVPSVGSSWDEHVALIHTLNSWERRISCVVHPQAEGVVESDKFGGIRTEVGPAGYVLSTGERITC